MGALLDIGGEESKEITGKKKKDEREKKFVVRSRKSAFGLDNARHK